MSQDYSPRDQGGEHTHQTDGGADFESYYELLGVDTDADTEEILQAYRDQMKKYHPDTSDLPEQEAERLFAELVTAREILEHPHKRRAYDRLGHEKYLEQSQELGQHIQGTDEEENSTATEETPATPRESTTDPQPQPASVDEPEPSETDSHNTTTTESQPSTRESQTTARGEAWKQGTAIPGTADKIFAERRSATAGAADTESDANQESSRSLFSVKRELSTTSIAAAGKRWGRSWRIRLIITLGFFLVVTGGHQVLPVIADRAGLTVSLPELSIGWLFALAISVGTITTAKVCFTNERELPRGGFVDDRELDQFTFEEAAAYRKRGYIYLMLPATLLITSAQASEQHPWDYTATVARGDFESGFPWFPPEALGLDSYLTTIDIVLTLGFILGTVLGAIYLAVGISISVWRLRYERGNNIRPSFWEPITTAALISILFALVAGNYQLFVLPGVSQAPQGIQTVFAMWENQITVGTFAGVGIVLLLFAGAYCHVRLKQSNNQSQRS